jgi:hypothetical protein
MRAIEFACDKEPCHSGSAFSRFDFDGIAAMRGLLKITADGGGIAGLLFEQRLCRPVRSQLINVS